MSKKNKVPLKITHFGQTNCFATCKTCGWMDDDHVTASGNASSHAKLTGHTVHVEKSFAYEVKPLEED